MPSAIFESVMNRVPTRMHAAAASEISDRYALLAAFVLGAVGSVALKFTDLHPIVPALWAGAVLVSYVAAIWWIGRLRIEPETAGDNCYYLGFVFTLTSLAVTLYQMTGSEVGQETIRNVISGFGIALSSTIVGIILRVWLIRQRPDIVSRDREARIELHNAVRDFRTALADSTAMIKTFAIESAQLMGEERAKLGQLTGEVIESQRKAVQKGAELQVETLERTIAAGAEKSAAAIAAAVEQGLGSASETLARAVAEIRDGVAELVRTESETLRRLLEDSRKVSTGGAEAERAMTDLASRLGALAQQMQDVSSTMVKRLNAASRSIERASATAASRIEESFSKLGDAAEQVSSPQHLERAAKALEAPVVALEDTAARLDALGAQLGTRAGKALDEPVAALEHAAARISTLADQLEMRTEQFAEVPSTPKQTPAEPRTQPSSRSAMTGTDATVSLGGISSEPEIPSPWGRRLWPWGDERGHPHGN
jgi:hypothetical protein